MKITDYFIKHPVSAIVLNTFFILLGWMSLQTLSLREYPEVDIPRLSIRTHYPSASAELVETSVTNVLEDVLAGIEGVENIASWSRSGVSVIELKFRVGSSMDRALMATREATGLVSSSLPKKAHAPVIEKASQNEGFPFMVLSLESSSMDFGELTHYGNLNLKNALRSLKGVASVQVWGQPYSYVVTIDPEKLFEFGVNIDEIYEALEKANLSLPAGQFRKELPVTLQSDLKSTKDYENLLVKTFSNSKGEKKSITLGMLAKIEMKSENEQFRVRLNTRTGLCLAINQTHDGNPLEVSQRVREEIKRLQPSLPSGLKLDVVIDQADFIRSSLRNIESTIFEAIALVLVVVFLFLKKWKAALVPLVTIPISLLGSFLFLQFFGFSINLMTLLAMVLAIGLVVDDAIIVLENIARYLEEGLSPQEAALKGAREIGFAIVAMTLTLTSVYMPIAFVQGMMGDLFIEFATALAGSVLISGVVALTLSPVMCASLLDHEKNSKGHGKGFFFRLEARYHYFLKRAMDRPKSILLLAATSLIFSAILFQGLPSEMAPKEDRGMIGVYVPPLVGKTIDDMEKKIIDIEKMVEEIPEKKGILSFLGGWGGSVIMPLKPIKERARSAQAIVDEIMLMMMKIPSVDAWPWSSDSALPGVENRNAQELSLAVCTLDSYKELFENMQAVREALESSSFFDNVHHNLRLDTMGYQIDLDTSALSRLGISPYQVARTIEVFFSADQSLTFQKDGMLYPITIQSSFAPWSLEEIYITSPNQQRLSLGSLATMKMRSQPKELAHYNQMRSAILKAEISKGHRLDEARDFIEKIVSEKLPTSYRVQWTGSAKEQEESDKSMMLLFALALVFIYAILAVQFENFKDPLIVMATVPLGAVGALALVSCLGQSMNIYTQIGLITLVGLITKHGILIVEFANQQRLAGLGVREAVCQAASMRLRPILMTTGAMIVGSLPLLFSQDAGAEARQVLGAVLVGGLTFGTFFTLWFIPVLYSYMKRFERST